MSCWKTINLTKDYGGMRIVLAAISLMIIFFIPEYLAMQLIHPQTVQKGDHALLFTGILVGTIIAHKILHLLPNISRKKIEKKMFWLKMRTWREIPKNLMLVSLLLPFSVITPFFFYAGAMIPELAHYFCIISSIHFGYCLPDFLLAWKLAQAPKNSYVDQEADDFDILIQK
ncbi:DUF3267 domain-containing protein [Bacillus sp. CLL-7-23]|uniref:DUF3267 domain-containing protein n=1 Tax=Bacillus changyiensis TaxID=3004103 RepID=A0ABT4X3H6_9BACI|nr:DUF3267 domain-containing protein [Bacillus changyiensis]MDA7025986.1 DUF3267 domain-containing protein [Bacillus changyiensis]